MRSSWVKPVEAILVLGSVGPYKCVTVLTAVTSARNPRLMGLKLNTTPGDALFCPDPINHLEVILRTLPHILLDILN